MREEASAYSMQTCPRAVQLAVEVGTSASHHDEAHSGNTSFTDSQH